MFLFIFANGDITKKNCIPEEIRQQAYDGYYTIVNMSAETVSYDGENWSPIEENITE